MCDEMTVYPAVSGCVHVLERCELVLGCIPEELFTRREGKLDSIGSHLRHGLEHMICFLDGLESGVVDYDLRLRDEQLETDMENAQEVIGVLRERLLSIAGETIEKPLRLCKFPLRGVRLWRRVRVLCGS